MFDHVSVRWYTQRDLLDAPESVWAATRARVAEEGWGARLLALRADDGTWGGGLYQPKWTSTFYTLRLLVQLGIPSTHAAARDSCRLLVDQGVTASGAVSLWSSGTTDTCVTAMLVSMACNLGLEDVPGVSSMMGYLVDNQMEDGGWNCRQSSRHASFHTTLSTMEALFSFQKATHPDADLQCRWDRASRFFLNHQLYRSHRTGEIVRASFALPHFPTHWFFDVLRGLAHFADANAPWDDRLDCALQELTRRERRGRWHASTHTGPMHFRLEPSWAPSRMNTLRALRVMWWARRAREGALAEGYNPLDP